MRDQLYDAMLDHVTVDGVRVGELTILGRYNGWDVFRQLIYANDLQGRVVRRGLGVQGHLVGLCLWCMTALSSWYARVAGTRLLIFSVDKSSVRDISADFRIEALYRTVLEKRVRYIEFFHTEVRVASVLRAARRGRAALYLEGIDWPYHVRRLFVRSRAHRAVIGGLEHVPQESRALVEATVRAYVESFGLVEHRLHTIRKLLTRIGVRTVIGIDDARYYHELSGACTTLGIPFTVFQHGHITPVHVGWLCDPRLKGELLHPDRLVVWNQYWKDECVRLGVVWDEHAIVVGGSTKRASPHTLRYASEGTVVIPYEVEAPKGVLAQAVHELARAGCRVLYKVRPDRDRTAQLAVLGDAASHVTALTDVTGPVRAVLGTYSTYLYDAVAAGIPVGIIDTPLRYTEGPRHHSIMDIGALGSLSSLLEKLDDLSSVERRRRQSLMEDAGELGAVLGNILDNVQ